MNVSLPKQIVDVVSEQVSSGRFKGGHEVVRAALRQMAESERQREMQSFESAFREIDQHSPTGEHSSQAK